jgi:uncharacterized membrane protein YphA (DoxX/SURF4 family)
MSSFLYVMIRLCLGTIFLFSGATKLMKPVSFTTLINAYGFIPENLTLPFAVFLAVFEIISGIGLLFDMKGSLTAITGLLILFMMVLSYGIYMGLDVDCGCFDPEDPDSAAFHDLRSALYRDIFFIANVIFLYAYRFRNSVAPKPIQLLFKNIIKGVKKNEAT